MIKTWSKFNYGTSVTLQNYLGDFQESGGALLATLETSGYTLGELIVQVQSALNAIGDNDYVVSLNRATGMVTVSANHNFSILLLTGASIGASFWPTIGFTQSIDLTGAATYTGQVPAGKIYYPQFLLQSYVGPDANQASLDSTINRTASGRTERVRFGVEKFIDMDVKFITNKAMDGIVIKNNPSGLADAIAFLEDITSKARFEFVPDASSGSTFYKVILENTQGFKDGTGFKLKELFMQNLPDIYETGVLTLRVVA